MYRSPVFPPLRPTCPLPGTRMRALSAKPWGTLIVSDSVGISTCWPPHAGQRVCRCCPDPPQCAHVRSEEHTSELQSQSNLVCRLLLEKTQQGWFRELSLETSAGKGQICGVCRPR